jgi:hypothetical protein
VWGNESSHSQVSSHFRYWSLDGLLNLQRAIVGVKTHWIEEFLISLEIILFDSQSLKVRNRPNFLTCRWRATYRWKVLEKGYNFALNIISIGGLHTKLWPLKVAGVPTLGISGLPSGSLGIKWHLGVGPVAKHRVYYKGEGGGFPQVRAVVSLTSSCFCMWLVRAPKALKLCTNQLVVWFVYVHVNNQCLSFFLVPILELQHALLPPKRCERGSAPQLLTFSLFSPQTHIWVYQGAWEHVRHIYA